MAPAFNTSTSSFVCTPSSESVDRSVLPDSLITSGQHNPDYAQIQPYVRFPNHITGPTVWKAEEYRDHPERWTHVFGHDEIAELGAAADAYMASGAPLTDMTLELFPLPQLAPFFGAVRREVVDGKGFILFKGIPVQDWGLKKSATAYMGLGAYFGHFTSQNGKGHILGHVKDLGEDPTQKDKVRIYRTNAKQYFHTDGSDLVGLLCIAKALEGGESDIVSTHHVFNTLQQEHPDVVETLVTPNWYFDRKGEVGVGQDPWYKSSIIYLEPCRSNGRVWAKFDPNNVTSLARYSSGSNPPIPPLSDKQRHAIQLLEETCSRLALHMILDPGDIQLLSNTHVFHARTAYKDYPPGSADETGRERVRRHLMRLWLAVPEDEGGWKTPFHDCNAKRRGGIQVNNNPPVCPLDAE